MKPECPICGVEIDVASFRDFGSKEEFGISGMCQKCQDDIFSELDDDDDWGDDADELEYPDIPLDGDEK